MQHIRSSSSGFSTQQGFTLVELAVALTIIALIIGGILMGADLVKSAEVRAAAHEMQALRSGYITFQEKYRCIPGDCDYATRFLEVAVNGDGNKLIGCDGPQPECTATTPEHEEAFNQMMGAGLLRSGTVGDGEYMTAKINECQFFILEHRHSPTQLYAAGTMNYLRINQNMTDGTHGDCLSPQQAFNLDEKMDDGRASTGRILGVSQDGDNLDCADKPTDEGRQADAAYNTLNEGMDCSLFIRLN